MRVALECTVIAADSASKRIVSRQNNTALEGIAKDTMDKASCQAKRDVSKAN